MPIPSAIERPVEPATLSPAIRPQSPRRGAAPSNGAFMTEYLANPPDAAALMTSARSFGNYDLAGAIADLIDNSIRADARRIDLTCSFNDGDPEIRTRDDGSGMTKKELHAAMRPASTNPMEERLPGDLGRFGWGLKSASFSQCRRLIVVTHRDRLVSGAVWDLSDIADWKMGVLDTSESSDLCSRELLEGAGTEVIWRDCDRLSEDRTLDSNDFNAQIVHARERLALIFHRFLSGDAAAGKLRIFLNGTRIAGSDPFYRKHNATQTLEMEPLSVTGGHRVDIQPYILPHYSKLRGNELEAVAGDEGTLKNQGFYVYRNDRLILYGTWFRLVQHGELSQLVRVSIDIPNSIDNMWKLTLDKSDAQLPTVLRSRLRQLVAKLKGRSARVHRSKGGSLAEDGPTKVWRRFARRGEIRYAINRDHPLIEALFDDDEADGTGPATAALAAIEQGFPVGRFGADVSGDIDAIHQTPGSLPEFRELLGAALPHLLAQADGDIEALRELLKRTEPFSANWTAVEDFLSAEGWTSA